MITADEKLSILNMSGGEVAAKFDQVMQSVLANITDPNTAAQEAREVTLKVTLKPTDDRSLVMITSKITPKVSHGETIVSKALVGGYGKNTEAREFVSQKQMEIAGVTDIEEKRRKDA